VNLLTGNYRVDNVYAMIRVLQTVTMGLMIFCLVGCSEPEQEPEPDKVKIGDLAPYYDGKPQQPKLLKTLNFDVHIYEIPAGNIDNLKKIRDKLYIKPLRLSDYPAFEANSFSVRFGQYKNWDDITTMLLASDAKKIANVSLMLPDGQSETITITGLNVPSKIHFTGTSGLREEVNVSPGIFGLLVKADKIQDEKGVCNITAYPIITPMTKSTIPTIEDRVRLREFSFTAAAFGLKMSRGDFIYLGPKEYISDQTALSGLFFSNPRGSLFPGRDERTPPERKPAVRIYLLICTMI
jgi:hypothetical protein